MKVTMALIAGTAQARVKDFCSLKQVPSDYECLRGHAGMWECFRECPFGAGKRRMDCECSQLHGCQWNSFEGWCIKDETTTTEPATTTSTTTTSATTTSTTSSTTTTSTTTTSTTTTTTTTPDEIEAEEETTRAVTEVLQTTTMNDNPVEFTFEIDDLNAACPTDLAPDGNTWTCYSEFQVAGDTTTCTRQCQDGSGQAEIKVCTCSGFQCSWESEAECMYAEALMNTEKGYHVPTTTLEQQTTTIMLESTTTTALHTPTEVTTMRLRSMMMDAVENQAEQEEEEAEEAEEPEEPEPADEVEPEEDDDDVTEDADDQVAPIQSDSDQTDDHTDQEVDQDEASQTETEQEPEGEKITHETETNEESAQEKTPTDQNVVKLELDNATQDDLDEQTSGNPFSGFLQSLQQFAKMTLVSIDEGFVQPVRYSLGIEENPK